MGVKHMNKPNPESETDCCRKFNPDPWDHREVIFSEKLFLTNTVRTVLRIPVNYGQVIMRSMKKIKKHNACSEDSLILYEDIGPFSAKLHISVSKHIPDGSMTKMSGKYLTKVFEGEYKQIGEWTKQMDAYVKSKSKSAEKILTYYTTCPRCAQFYKKNYVVILAKIKE